MQGVPLRVRAWHLCPWLRVSTIGIRLKRSFNQFAAKGHNEPASPIFCVAANARLREPTNGLNNGHAKVADRFRPDPRSFL